MFHYTYLLKFCDGKLYHGVRSSEVAPELDNYYGSSKYTPKDEVPEKIILSVHDTRKEAVLEEVRYHSEHDVKCNDLYINRANQKTDGFDTYGIQLSDEHKQKIRDNHPKLCGENHPAFGKESKRKGVSIEEEYGKEKADEIRKKISENREYKYGKDHPNYNMHHSEETKKKISESKMGRPSWNKGVPMSKETKDKLSKSRKNTHVSKNKYKFITNDGEEFLILSGGIRNWFRQIYGEEFPSSLRRTLKTNNPAIKGKWKGYKVELL